MIIIVFVIIINVTSKFDL